MLIRLCLGTFAQCRNVYKDYSVKYCTQIVLLCLLHQELPHEDMCKMHSIDNMLYLTKHPSQWCTYCSTSSRQTASTYSTLNNCQNSFHSRTSWVCLEGHIYTVAVLIKDTCPTAFNRVFITRSIDYSKRYIMDDQLV